MIDYLTKYSSTELQPSCLSYLTLDEFQTSNLLPQIFNQLDIQDVISARRTCSIFRHHVDVKDITTGRNQWERIAAAFKKSITVKNREEFNLYISNLIKNVDFYFSPSGTPILTENQLEMLQYSTKFVESILFLSNCRKIDHVNKLNGIIYIRDCLFFWRKIGVELDLEGPDLHKLNTLKDLDLQFKEYKNWVSQNSATFTDVRALNMNCQYFYCTPNDLKYFTNLKTLSLNRNYSSKFKQIFKYITSLKKLELESNNLKRLPSSIKYLTRLKNLNLRNNYITSLPDYLFNGCLRLTYLNFALNELTSLPQEIENLTQLREINLKGNHLTQLPNLSKLTNLRVLIVNDNELLEINSDIKKLTSLTRLNLKNNRLTHWPEEFDSEWFKGKCVTLSRNLFPIFQKFQLTSESKNITF